MEYNQSYVKVSIDVTENEWEIENLFELAIRKNKKRSFLFASTVLGKYMAVHPYVPQLIGMILAEIFYLEIEREGIDSLERAKKSVRMKTLMEGLERQLDDETFNELRNDKKSLSENTLFIGFAETATGLGHSVFSSFKDHCSYLHTTRMPILNDVPTFNFKEEHSHAVDHTCFNRELADLDGFKRIVLIDDEITTGKTALNLIKAITKEIEVREFVVISILDWRNTENIMQYEALEEELGIRIWCIALVKGTLSVEQLKDIQGIQLNNEKLEWNKTLQAQKEKWDDIWIPLDQRIELQVKQSKDLIKNFEFLKKATGRFGVTSEEQLLFEKRAREIGDKLAVVRKYDKCLCLGTEEFIYWPLTISGYMGEKISFACSARSPIVTLDQEGYAIKDAICFDNPEEPSLLSYVYNLQGRGYEEVFWFLERNVSDEFKESICRALRVRGIKLVHFVIL